MTSIDAKKVTPRPFHDIPSLRAYLCIQGVYKVRLRLPDVHVRSEIEGKLFQSLITACLLRMDKFHEPYVSNEELASDEPHLYTNLAGNLCYHESG